MRTKKILASIALLMSLLLPALQGWAEESCAKDVCVETVQEGTTVAFTVKNLQAADATVTFKVELTNMVASEPMPHTLTVQGKSTRKAFTLSIDDDAKAWRYQYWFHWITGSKDAKHDDESVYALPYHSDAAFKVIQAFHGTYSHFGEQEYAIDWEMPEGTAILAARAGVVVGVKEDEDRGGASETYRDYANYVRVRHSDGTIGEYVHLRKDGATVNVGDAVAAGDQLGFSGNTGFSSTPHLHFWVFKAVDGYTRASFPIRFKTREGSPIRLKQGRKYTAK